ncbi:MAG: DEAD/DEAH box helicase [Mailhella sp.]|nr:DEAD/DEAH box helicase [Mailhella sp.]
MNNTFCAEFAARFPIGDIAGRFQEELRAARRVVVCAPPGAGKTAVLPLLAADASGGRAVVTEPRRLAAVRAARFLAGSLGSAPGGFAGYSVRLESRVCAETQVEFVTEGILTRRILADPELPGVSCLIFDEFHERSLQSDFGLALALEIQEALRPDLAIVVMSATLNAETVSAYMAPCSVLKSEGLSHPVEIRYQERLRGRDGRDLADAVANGVLSVLRSEKGSVLAFLPGRGDIVRCAGILAGRLPLDTDVYPLYGEMPLREQENAVRPAPPGRRKVVLSTNIAETSLTLDGVSVVVDSGFVKRARYDASTDMNVLETVRISRAQAEQRAGRAGRQGPGVCLRLWDKNSVLAEQQKPEIAVTELSGLALDTLRWGSMPDAVRFLTAPPGSSVRAAFRTLRLLGAAEAADAAGRAGSGSLAVLRPERDGHASEGLAASAVNKDGAVSPRMILTQHGKDMTGIPLPPRLAHMLLFGRKIGLGPLAAALAALLSERLRGGPDIRQALYAPDPRRDKLAAYYRSIAGIPDAPAVVSDSAGILIAAAYPDKIAGRRGRAYVLSGGGGAFLPPDGSEPLAGCTYLAAAALEGGRILAAAPLEKDDIMRYFADAVSTEDSYGWEKGSAVRRVCLGHIVLDETPLPEPSPEVVQCAFWQAFRNGGLSLLPWDDKSGRFRSRAAFCRRLDPAWPDLGDEALLADAEWLEPWIGSIRSRRDVAAFDMTSVLRSAVPHRLLQEMDRLAPERIPVPSGRLVPVDYSVFPPVLAVKLQEMFGLAESPKVGDGRVTLCIHLLSPAGRPLQITNDLPGFWKGSYAAVRSEMRGRYPKHPWPEDPLEAVPTAKTTKAMNRK